MAIDRAQVVHIAALARIGLTETEVEAFAVQLSNILEQFEVLNELDTSGVEPTSNAGQLESVMREDVARDSLDRSDVMANAPRREGDFFRVKAVLQE